MTDAQYQPPYPGADPDEIAQVNVGTSKSFGKWEAAGAYSDWESVWIQLRIDEGWPLFRFTCAERDPVAELWSRLQFRPGDSVVITLGGVVAIAGWITVRQVAYDANSHGVSFQGVGRTWEGWRASIIDPKEKNEFPGGLMEVANQVLAPWGGATAIGDIDGTPFKPPAHCEPGQTCWDFLDKLARDRKAVVGFDEYGRYTITSNHDPPSAATLVEGENIQSAQVVWSVMDAYNPYISIAQSAGTTGHSEGQAAQIKSDFVHSVHLQRYSPLLTPVEHPVWTKKEVDLRNQFEQHHSDGSFIEATIVVYGWFVPGTHMLWKPRMTVTVRSPMAMLDQDLAVRTVTFTQDNEGGTRTTLELVEWERLMGKGIVLPESGNASLGSMPPDAATITGMAWAPWRPLLPPKWPGEENTTSGSF